MNRRCLLKYFFLFIGLQIALIVVFAILPFPVRKSFFETVYYIWLNLGETVFPSGPGGHALPGGADSVGFIFGMIVYALIPAFVVCYFRSRTERDGSR